MVEKISVLLLELGSRLESLVRDSAINEAFENGKVSLSDDVSTVACHS